MGSANGRAREMMAGRRSSATKRNLQIVTSSSVVANCHSHRMTTTSLQPPRQRQNRTVQIVLVVLCLLIFVASVSTNSSQKRISPRIVTTRYGAVRGCVITLPVRSLQAVEVFMGIPYASPPVGKLRFMPPVTSSHWTGVKNALSPGPICPQRAPEGLTPNSTKARHQGTYGSLRSAETMRHMSASKQNQSEDCLYLNIYAPATVAKKSSRLPVMMFIHGELHDSNAGSTYDGSVLASFGKVIVVTINFRLGVLGFFPELDGSTRGNFGLMDCVAALHWIQENVNEFGGDPGNVTIFGHGKGASMVNILMFSPMAKGLFHRAIMSSGSVLSPWAVATNSVALSKKLSSALGCPHEDKLNAVMVDCLRQKTVEQILSVPLDIPSYLAGFGPTVDGVAIPNEPSLLMEEMSSLYGTYDLMFGVTEVEAFEEISHSEEAGIDMQRRDRILRTLVRNLFTYNLQEIFLTLANEYTDWSRPITSPLNVWQSLVDLLGDALIVAPTIKSGLLHAKFPTMSSAKRKTTTWFYQFQGVEESASSPGPGPGGRQGTLHGDDLAFVFGAPLMAGHQLGSFHSNYSKAEAALSEIVITLWTNFAKYGNPNGQMFSSVSEVTGSEAAKNLRFSSSSSPASSSSSSTSSSSSDIVHWPRYEEQQQQYLSITTKPKIKDHYHAHRLSYWLNLFPKLHVAGESSTLKHHLLEDHDNPQTYEGNFRLTRLQVQANGAQGSEATAPQSPPPQQQHKQQHRSSTATQATGASGGGPQSAKAANESQPSRDSALLSDDEPASSANSAITGSPPNVSRLNSTSSSSSVDNFASGNSFHLNNSLSPLMASHERDYSTALSVTIAVGCSLLILNIIVLSGFFCKRGRGCEEPKATMSKNFEELQNKRDATRMTKHESLHSPGKVSDRRTSVKANSINSETCVNSILKTPLGSQQQHHQPQQHHQNHQNHQNLQNHQSSLSGGGGGHIQNHNQSSRGPGSFELGSTQMLVTNQMYHSGASSSPVVCHSLGGTLDRNNSIRSSSSSCNCPLLGYPPGLCVCRGLPTLAEQRGCSDTCGGKVTSEIVACDCSHPMINETNV